LNLLITASSHCETPIHVLDDSRQVPPKPHRAVADEPIVPEPSGIGRRASAEILESTQNLDGAAFRSRWHPAAVAAEAPARLSAPASSAMSLPLETGRYI